MDAVPDKETLGRIADLFKAFGDPTRVEIMSLLEKINGKIAQLGGYMEAQEIYI